VICIGAGVSGILTAIKFPPKIKNLDLVIYEKSDDIGGTWHENRYENTDSIMMSMTRADYRYPLALDTLAWLATFPLTVINSPLQTIPIGVTSMHRAPRSSAI
jgi:cation diffusion facilitator CzcD-associated flavoprotein CzcO